MKPQNLIASKYSIFAVTTVPVLSSVAKYTREAGVRQLERRIGAVCRAVAVKVAEHRSKQQAESEGQQAAAAAKVSLYLFLVAFLCTSVYINF